MKRVYYDNNGKLVLVDPANDPYIGNSSGTTYINSNPTIVSVGGIPQGTTFENGITFSEFLDMLLYPEQFPNLTDPSHTFTSTLTNQLYEVGQIIPTITFTASFNRGSISPQYESETPYRSGLPIRYIFEGSGLISSIYSSDLQIQQIVNNYQVNFNVQSWGCQVEYAPGVQPKGSRGTPFNTPLPQGITNMIYISIIGTFPIFANYLDISTMTKIPLQVAGTTILVEFPPETDSIKQRIEVPYIGNWINQPSQIQQYNTISATWDPIDKDTFTISTLVRNINGNQIDYTAYTHNGAKIGRRRLRFIFT